ncbi:hypothetical protein QP635_02865 [Staphylococcus hominis]|uniref:hypothetical protein n=1 Tax=Staphylococcus hominis TaxID=1290 RepID=UPI0008A4D92C|nr:hypothetical protein [Staphylococcus hominis]MDK7928835.1 hypothetical protein [Staphylococcus hominis]OFR08385.1 hypothetical protein HMPREF2905_09885 [Staphylococcus sp. HMSC078E07]
MQEKDERFVLREEFLDSNGKIYNKINENDKKHTEELKDLNNKVDKQIIYQEKAFESQSRSEKHLEKLSETMSSFGKEFTDVKYQVKDHTKQLETFSEVIKEKQGYNVKIIVAIISGIASVLVGALGFAAAFF